MQAQGLTMGLSCAPSTQPQELAMSLSCAPSTQNQYPSANPAPPVKEAPCTQYTPYAPPIARYDEVVSNRQTFMYTLEKLHDTMGTKFMIPIIGGKELDLHRLFVEVTSRGGVNKVINEKRWKEVTAVFSFPTTATNASYVLRKYYGSLLHHYEQVYYFKAKGWNPTANECLLPPYGRLPHYKAKVSNYQMPPVQQPRTDAANLPQVSTSTPTSAAGIKAALGTPVIGVIDGKFDSGYLVTVSIGSETLKGILYHAPPHAAGQTPQNNGLFNNVSSGVKFRKRRKKGEIRKRDPARPKPNRSGYNFFFAEQHARLRPFHPGRDRQISRIIGELWTKLKEEDRGVYQEKARWDKERYRVEMEGYRQKLSTGPVISDAVPIQQRLPELDEGEQNYNAPPEIYVEEEGFELREGDEELDCTAGNTHVEENAAGLVPNGGQ